MPSAWRYAGLSALFGLAGLAVAGASSFAGVWMALLSVPVVFVAGWCAAKASF